MIKRHGSQSPRLRAAGVPLARRSYILLETVIATGLLIAGLAVIGVQIQDAGTSIRKMERRTRAMLLAERNFAYMDLGLVELDSVDEVQEGDFGPRDPDWGWRLTTELTAVDGMFRLKLEILHHIREDDYQEDDFPYDDAEREFTAYAFRPAPQALDLAADYGLTEEELIDVSERLAEAGLQGFDVTAFDPAMLAKLEMEELIKSLPILLDALGLQLGDLEDLLPPEILRELEDAGLLDGEGESGDGREGGS